MIYKYEDFISALKEKHPGVTESSLKKIVKKGLFGVNKTMRGSGELLIRGTTIKGKNDWIKFYRYMEPDEQKLAAIKNYSRKHNKHGIDKSNKQIH